MSAIRLFTSGNPGTAMPIVFSCSGCKKKYEVGDHLAGKMGRCKQCGNQFRIPVPRVIASPKPNPKRESDLLDDFEEEDTFREDDELMGPGPEPEEDREEAMESASASSFGSRTPATAKPKKKKKKKAKGDRRARWACWRTCRFR